MEEKASLQWSSDEYKTNNKKQINHYSDGNLDI